MLSTKAILCQFFRDREAWKGLSEGKEQKELFCLSTYVCQRGPDACGFSSKVLCWYRQSHLTAPSVHFCFLTQPPQKIWCYSGGQSNQSVCHSWLVSPVVTWWTSCGVLLVWGFFWLWFLFGFVVLVGFGLFVCWLGLGGLVRGWRGFLIVFRQLSEKLVYEILTFSWTLASHWYVLSAGSICPTSQAVPSILCRATSLGFVSVSSFRLYRISHTFLQT